MNIPQYFNSPIIVPPVPCDDPTAGVPSNNSVPVCYPHTDRHNPPQRNFKTVTYRPLPDSSIAQFGQWITGYDFSSINDDLAPGDQAQALENTLITRLDEYCPIKVIRVGPQDKAWVNQEIKQIKRKKHREYTKKGKTEKYKQLSQLFDEKYKAAAEHYLISKIDALKETKPGKAFKILKDMGAQPGDCTDDHSFALPNHQAQNLSPKQSAEKKADHFASISQEYPPLNLDLLPDRVRQNLSTKTNPPIISEHECYQKIKAAKKPQSGVPGDLPS